MCGCPKNISYLCRNAKQRSPLLSTLLHINYNGLRVVVAGMAGGEVLPPQAFCSAQEREEYAQLGSSKRQHERAATLHLLHRLLGVHAPLHHHANGSPYLAGGGLHISISHAQHAVGIALHPTRKVGIDVESTQRNFARVAARFLSRDEQRYLLTQAQRCLAWCAKEAVYKAVGEQGVDFAVQILLEPIEEKSEGEVLARFIGKGGERSILLRYHLMGSTAVAYAVA